MKFVHSDIIESGVGQYLTEQVGIGSLTASAFVPLRYVRVVAVWRSAPR